MEDSPLVLLFDIDGTLIDSAGAGGGALLNALGSQFQLSETRPVPLHGRTDLGIMMELLESHGVEANSVTLSLLCERYFLNLPGELERRGGHVLPGVQDLLTAITLLEGCVTGILTGNMPTSAQAKLSHFDLLGFFDFGVYGDRAHHRPDLRDAALEAVRNRCGRSVPGQRIVIIGDTTLDVALAQAMGVRCLAVCTGGMDAQTLINAGADWVVDDLRQTARIIEWLQCPAGGS